MSLGTPLLPTAAWGEDLGSPARPPGGQPTALRLRRRMAVNSNTASLTSVLFEWGGGEER